MTWNKDLVMVEQKIDRWDALLNKHGLCCTDKGAMALRYQCGVGWMPILEDLFEEIAKEAMKAKLEGITVLQVKEKFGDLVVDVSNGNEAIYALVKAATKKATVTCEGCGKPGKKIECDGWYKTLCSRCYSMRDW